MLLSSSFLRRFMSCSGRDSRFSVLSAESSVASACRELREGDRALPISGSAMIVNTPTNTNPAINPISAPSFLLS